MSKIKNRITSEKGGGVLIVMMTLSMTIFLVATYSANSIPAITKMTAQSAVKNSAEMLKNNLSVYLMNNDSWSKTKNNYDAYQTSPMSSADAMACVATSTTINGQTSTSCSPESASYVPKDKNRLIIYQLSDNEPYYDPSSTTAGFNFEFERCNFYSATEGNDDCPFHPNIYWVKSRLSAGEGMVEIHIDINYNPGSPALKSSVNVSSSKGVADIRSNNDTIGYLGALSGGTIITRNPL